MRVKLSRGFVITRRDATWQATWQASTLGAKQQKIGALVLRQI